MMAYECTNDRYSQTRETFETIEEFRSYCRECFGEEPILTEQTLNGVVVNDAGEVVLREIVEFETEAVTVNGQELQSLTARGVQQAEAAGRSVDVDAYGCAYVVEE